MAQNKELIEAMRTLYLETHDISKSLTAVLSKLLFYAYDLEADIDNYDRARARIAAKRMIEVIEMLDKAKSDIDSIQDQVPF